MDDAMKRALLGDIVDRVGLDGIGQIVFEQNNTINVGKEPPVQLPPYLRRERAMELYVFLTDHSYIDRATSAEDFLYLMGVSSTAPLKLKPINWLTTVEQLRTMLQLAYEVPISRKAVTMAEIERRVPSCFLNKGVRMKQLAKPRMENSLERDVLLNFFRPKQR